LALLAFAGAAHAGEPVRLHWVRAEGAGACIDPATLEARVRERLGSDPFDARATRSIEGVVRRSGESWEAAIAVRARPTDPEPPLRELKSHGNDCDSLGEAVVLAVALAIDPAATFSTSPKPPPAAPIAPPVATATPPPAAGGSRGRAALIVASQAGLLPRASLGAGLVAAVGLGAHLELAAGAQVFPAVEVQGVPSYAIGLALGDLRACARLPRVARVDVSACGGPSAGVMTAAVLEGDRAQPGQRAWFGAELGLDAAIALPHALALRLGVQGVAPLTRYRFTIDGDVALFRQRAVAGVAYAGLELRFGEAR
jgi:hypothetical protein